MLVKDCAHQTVAGDRISEQRDRRNKKMIQRPNSLNTPQILAGMIDNP